MHKDTIRKGILSLFILANYKKNDLIILKRHYLEEISYLC